MIKSMFMDGACIEYNQGSVFKNASGNKAILWLLYLYNRNSDKGNAMTTLYWMKALVIMRRINRLLYNIHESRNYFELILWIPPASVWNPTDFRATRVHYNFKDTKSRQPLHRELRWIACLTDRKGCKVVNKRTIWCHSAKTDIICQWYRLAIYHA